jgi:uncharacterized membrane protein YhiD involved in acid resistance
MVSETFARAVAWLTRVPDPASSIVEHYKFLTILSLRVTFNTVLIIGLGFFVFGHIPALSSISPASNAALADASNKVTSQMHDLSEQFRSYQDQNKQYQESNNRWRATQLQNEMNDTRAKACKAKSDEGKRMYMDTLTHMKNQYRELTSLDYQLPACADL